jgi:hypothetical protein
MQQLQAEKGPLAAGKRLAPAPAQVPKWSISTQQADSHTPYQQQVSDGVTAVTISSNSWTQQDVAQMQQLVQQRNRFVCLQLVTMVQEQYQKVMQAISGRESAGMQQAELMHLSTLWAGGQLVAAALFYPRSCSKGGSHQPHVYVELVCCNTPGKGYGSMLMGHIERYVYEHQVVLAEALAAAVSAAGATTAAASTQGTSMCPDTTSSSGSAGSTNTHSHQSSAGSCPGSPGVSGGVISSTATSRAREALGDCPAGCHTYPSGGVQECATCSSPAMRVVGEQQPAPGDLVQPPLSQQQVQQQQQQQQQELQQELSSGAAASPHPPLAVPWLLQGIKLLSVESAQAFYLKNGYTGPDAWRELHKPIHALGHAASS